MQTNVFWDTVFQLWALFGFAVFALICLLFLEDMISSVQSWKTRRVARKNRLVWKQ